MANFNIGEVIYRKAHEGKEAFLILGVHLTPYKKFTMYTLFVEQIYDSKDIPWHERVGIIDHNCLLIASTDKHKWGKLDGEHIAE